MAQPTACRSPTRSSAASNTTSPSSCRSSSAASPTSQRLEALSALLPHVSASVRESHAGHQHRGVRLQRLRRTAEPDRAVLDRSTRGSRSQRRIFDAGRARRTRGVASARDGRRTPTIATCARPSCSPSATCTCRRWPTPRACVRQRAGRRPPRRSSRLATDQNAAGAGRAHRRRPPAGSARGGARAGDRRRATSSPKRKLQLARAIGLPASETFELTDAAAFHAGAGADARGGRRRRSRDTATISRAPRRASRPRERRARRGRGAAAQPAARRATSACSGSRRDRPNAPTPSRRRCASRSSRAAGRAPAYERGGRRAAQREAELADLDAGVRFEVRAALLDVRRRRRRRATSRRAAKRSRARN